MFVCICNAFTDRQVNDVLRRGAATTADQVYAALDCRPQCGRCMDMVSDMVRQHQAVAGLPGPTPAGAFPKAVAPVP